ncbi:MAG: glycerophosphodiester phosphodiesterase [Pseudobdellovibrio sp.]|nr:glycerophosphodiester phosphodiesterase [Pseudobdellovibrio sp.]
MTFLNLFYSLKPKTFAPPRLQCHRGFWVDGLQQNSLASLKKAYELGYKISEFDIRITKDHQVILFHDDKIGSQKVSEMTLAEVEKHQKVDSFESVMQWFSQTPVGEYHLNIEIKSKLISEPILEKKILDLILKYKVERRVLISSFNPFRLFYFRRHCPQIIRALLLTYENDPGNNLVLKSQVLNLLAKPDFLHLNEKYWSPERYKTLLKQGVPVVLWTCNDPEQVKKYFQQGVYGVISDALKPDDVKNFEKTSHVETIS